MKFSLPMYGATASNESNTVIGLEVYIKANSESAK